MVIKIFDICEPLSIMSNKIKNMAPKIKIDRGLVYQPIIIVTNSGPDCEEDWAKSELDAITEDK